MSENEQRPMDHHMDELRRAYPAKGRAADHENSRAAAIDLYCLGCAQSREEVRNCPSFRCALWPFRPYQDNRARPAGTVPTLEEYAAHTTATGRGNAGNFAKANEQRKKKGQGAGDDDQGF